MIIKNIVNQDVVNISNCESEPIHIPGSIQPHGFLLGINSHGHEIIYCSENCIDFIGISAKDILGKHYADIFDCDEAIRLTNYLNDPLRDTSRPYVCIFKDVQYNTTVHNSGNVLVLELEPFPDGSIELPNLYIQTRQFVSALQETMGLQGLCQSIAEEIHKITGYDRVMVYRFDKDYNGEVFAEAKRDGLEAFLGLHYPHTDIPVQARQLYLKNLMRMISDVNYIPVPIVTQQNNADNSSLDLSLSVLRSVSPIHIEYLKNMGVGATLTISLIQDKKLWGLIACHHYGPKNIPHYIRLTALLQAHFLTSQIKVREVTEEHELTLAKDQMFQELLHFLNNNEHVEQYISHPQLIKLVDADGVSIIYNDTVYTNGNTPSKEQVIELATYLQNKKYAEFVTNNIQSALPHLKGATGAMYFSLNPTSHNSIIWFRNELEQTIHWAGEPDKAIVKDEKGLSPRKSFALWKEIVKGFSKDWLKVEVNAAAKCAYALQKQFSLSDIRKEEEVQRKLSNKLRLANEELSNLNWIGTHDLKEPLRKIQIFASKILETSEYNISSEPIDLIERMRKSAGRMQNLIEDILNYSRLTTSENKFTEIKLNDVLSEVKVELEDLINEKQVKLTAQDLPVINGVWFQVRQLFINLLSNAIKFAKPGTTPEIEILSEKARIPAISGNNQVYHKITFSDKGIGFDDKYGNVIFKVFQRLNGISVYEGTGIGLAICKKVMEVHDGFIEAKGEEGSGAKFIVYFPVL